MVHEKYRRAEGDDTKRFKKATAIHHFSPSLNRQFKFSKSLGKKKEKNEKKKKNSNNNNNTINTTTTTTRAQRRDLS